MDCMWIAGHMDCGGKHEKQGLVNLGPQVKEKLVQSTKNTVSIKPEYCFNQTRILFQSSKILFKSHQAVLLKAIDTWIRPIVEAIYF